MKAGFLEEHEIQDLIAFLEGNMDESRKNTYYFPFLERYNPMLYGTGDAQSCYLRAEEVWKNPPKSLSVSSVKAAMNGISIGGKTQYDRVSNYWLEQVQGKTNSIEQKKAFTVKDAKGSGAPKQGFWERFDASKLSIEAKEQKQGGLTAPKAAESKRGEKREIIYDNLIRRSCKFLLYDAVDQRRPVAYALDELDLAKVAYMVSASGYPQDARARYDEDSKSIVSDNEAKIPVCSSELRELFRYWDHFRDHIVFFKGFMKTDAPWYDPGMAEKWAAYAKHRAAKLLAVGGTQKKNAVNKDLVQKCLDASGIEAIHRYHELRPSKVLGRGMQVHGVSVENETKSADMKGRNGKRQ